MFDPLPAGPTAGFPGVPVKSFPGKRRAHDPLGAESCRPRFDFPSSPLGQGRDRAGAFSSKFEAGRFFFHAFALVTLIRREKY